jgi:hypothetical protein
LDANLCSTPAYYLGCLGFLYRHRPSPTAASSHVGCL